MATKPSVQSMELGIETKHHGLSHKDRVHRRSLQQAGGGGVAARRGSATGIGGGGEVISSRPREAVQGLAFGGQRADSRKTNV